MHLIELIIEAIMTFLTDNIVMKLFKKKHKNFPRNK
jgi:hypothetical protein